MGHNKEGSDIRGKTVAKMIRMELKVCMHMKSERLLVKVLEVKDCRMVKDDSESFRPHPSREQSFPTKMPALIVSIVHFPVV